MRKLLTSLGLSAFYISAPEHVRYVSGFTGENGHLIVTDDAMLLITDKRYTEQAEQETNCKVIVQTGPIFETLARYLPPARVGYENTYLTEDAAHRLFAAAKSVTWVPVPDALRMLRMVKTEAEISSIRTACEIADAAFADLLPILKPGMTEREVRAELEYRLSKGGSERLSFDTIVASGVRGSLPHADPTDAKLALNDLVTIDFGAVYHGYHSDTTRTICFGRPALFEVWEAVLEVQEKLVQAVRPGVTGKELCQLQRELFSHYELTPYLVHSLGHGVGLEVHEEPRISDTSSTVLAPGMVITIEPGIYLPGKGGVRTEDTVLVTESGFECLTHAPHHILISERGGH
mgnify:CR=1 FL=1